MKTKHIPALVMLLGGAVACVVAFINHYPLGDMLSVLSISLMIFLCIGIGIKIVFDSFKLPETDEDKVNDEGEVIEKQQEEAEDDSMEKDTEDGSM